MKKIIINEREIGLLYKNGKFIKPLLAGKHYITKSMEVEVRPLCYELMSEYCELNTLLLNDELKNMVDIVEVKENEYALHFEDGVFKELLVCGKHAFFKSSAKHEFQITDISSPEVGEDISKRIFRLLPKSDFIRVDILEYQKGRLYFDNVFKRILEPGTYYFWNTHTKVDVGVADTRLTQINITGQELLTADKVQIRINFVCNYKITDFVKVLLEVDDYKEQIHIAVQLALREYVGKLRLDEILANKEEISEFVFKRLKEKEDDLFVAFSDAGVKDIILPGEIRDIMNTVLIAEKRAQANVITRREEVASTRSLLNTAKLMDENKTLYKLKELEYIERICTNVGNINLNSGSDVLNQLAAVLSK